MQGMLFLCATPIGNLGDMTPRAIETLREADVIAAEDTRNSIKLLNHFDIHTPMTSYHEYNKVEKARELIGRMKNGENVALISDAGTPAISDPGEVLVQMCHEESITVTSLPGPCACITALTLSGISARRFCFEGFLPADKKEREAVLVDLAHEKRTIILYEAPHHLKKTIALLLEKLGDRKVALCRELTKKFEEVRVTTLAQANAFYEANEPRGEYVIVLEGKSRAELEAESRKVFEEIPIEEHVARYEREGMDTKEAMKRAAKDRGITKREVYQYLLQKKND